MPETSPGVALAAASLALALLLLPGWLMLRLVRVRGLFSLALAPACSTAVLAAGAILAQLVGVRWSLHVAAGSALLGLALALLVRRLTTEAPPSPRVSRADVALLAAGLLLAVVPTLAAMGSLDAYLQRWDAVFHLAALQFISESGSASSLTLGALSYGHGQAAIYPAGWHALGSLLPGSPTAALAIGATVTSALPWVLGSGLLAAELTRPSRTTQLGVIGVGGLLAGIVTAVPMSLWTGWGHVPNAAALAMLPAALALALRLLRDPAGRPVALVALAVALLGMALTHPNAVLAAFVLMLPALIGAVVRAVRAPAGTARWVPPVLLPALATAAVVGVLAFFLLSPLAASVTGYATDEVEPFGVALAEVASGRYRLWPTLAGTVIAVLALAGVIAALVQRRLLPALTLLVAWVLYIDSATGGHLQISRLWYTSPARLSVVVTAIAVPLAAGALVAAGAWAHRRVGSLTVALAAAVLVVAISVPSVTGRTFRVANVFEDAPGHPPQFVTTGELEMIADLPDVVDGSILGSPFSGASSAYGLVGVRVVFPVAGQVWSPDQQLIMDNLDQLASGEVTDQVCDAVERLEVRYLYQDTAPYQADPRYEALDLLEPVGATVIAEGDTARVLWLSACDE